MSDKLVTIAQFETAIEGELAKGCLEENDIKATVVGENLVANMVPIPMIAPIELKVFVKDAERAKGVLEIHKAQCQAAADEQAQDE